jgi:hypothetical protein
VSTAPGVSPGSTVPTASKAHPAAHGRAPTEPVSVIDPSRGPAVRHAPSRRACTMPDPGATPAAPGPIEERTAMKQQGKQTKRGTSQKPLAARKARPQDTAVAPGIAKPGQEPDTGQGAIDHHQSNHGRRGR